MTTETEYCEACGAPLCDSNKFTRECDCGRGMCERCDAGNLTVCAACEDEDEY